MRAALAIATSLLALAALATQAQAKQAANLHVSFSPYKLGHPTNVGFDVNINAPTGQIPSPLTALELRYPRQLGFAVSGLGLETCPPRRLQALGPEVCPADSHMGQGTAIAEIPFGPEIIHETAEVAILRAPEQEGHIGLLFYAHATEPVSAQIAFPGALLPAAPPKQETIAITVPLVPGLPEGPDVAVVQLHATFGPHGLTYYEHTHGKLIAYHPQGILLPNKCPKGGFTFSANLTFLDGSHTQARTAVACGASLTDLSRRGGMSG
jgi:hypothetical protein